MDDYTFISVRKKANDANNESAMRRHDVIMLGGYVQRKPCRR